MSVVLEALEALQAELRLACCSMLMCLKWLCMKSACRTMALVGVGDVCRLKSSLCTRCCHRAFFSGSSGIAMDCSLLVGAVQHSSLTSAEQTLGHAAPASMTMGWDPVCQRAVLPAHLMLLCFLVILCIHCGLQVAHLQLMQQEAATAHMEQVIGFQQQVELEGRQRWEEAEARALAQQRLKVGSTHAMCHGHALLLETAHCS